MENEVKAIISYFTVLKVIGQNDGVGL